MKLFFLKIKQVHELKCTLNEMRNVIEGISRTEETEESVSLNKVYLKIQGEMMRKGQKLWGLCEIKKASSKCLGC
jgi:hypothetical protein